MRPPRHTYISCSVQELSASSAHHLSLLFYKKALPHLDFPPIDINRTNLPLYTVSVTNFRKWAITLLNPHVFLHLSSKSSTWILQRTTNLLSGMFYLPREERKVMKGISFDSKGLILKRCQILGVLSFSENKLFINGVWEKGKLVLSDAIPNPAISSQPVARFTSFRSTLYSYKWLFLRCTVQIISPSQSLVWSIDPVCPCCFFVYFARAVFALSLQWN